jgi:hypothetical protein
MPSLGDRLSAAGHDDCRHGTTILTGPGGRVLAICRDCHQRVRRLADPRRTAT